MKEASAVLCSHTVKALRFAIIGTLCLYASASSGRIEYRAHSADELSAAAPNFSGVWDRRPGKFEQPVSGLGPVEQISKNRDVPIGNYKNPILQPWAAAIVRHNGESEAAGHPVPEAKTTCWPGSVPGILAVQGSVQILQTPQLVTLLFSNDHQVRFIYMNRAHVKNMKPSWYGESVGHYEGDTLVVDTIGIAAKPMSFIDSFGTPHTDKLHVVERYRLAPGGQAIKIDIHVEDPGAFTAPWNAIATLRRSQYPFEEYVCAENNPLIDVGPTVGHMPRAKYVVPF